MGCYRHFSNGSVRSQIGDTKKHASEERTYFHDVALEGIYQLQAPGPDQLGVALLR